MLRLFMAAFVVCCHFLLSGETQNEFMIIENQATLPILTPCFAERQTLKLRLKNELEVYIISDPQVDKASAALTVRTGSWEDPVASPGIAHFLEHMLFLGTKKYPQEAEYHRFITEHGGQTNAFTSSDITSYVFTVDNSAFPQALDRFSSFFIEPLFNPSGVDRELQAINQEYSKNLESDDIREYYVHKALSNPSHPNHTFSMGNQASLQKVSQETLKTWYREHYSANRMRLEVISNLPLDRLQDLVIDAFSLVSNYNLPKLHVDAPILPDSIKGHMVYIEPVKNIRKLSLIWELPPQFADMRDTKPEHIVCSVLGHEGKNSLLFDLKREKLADGLSCGASKVGSKNYEFFLQISLTDAGVKNVDKVILKCFQAIANFKAKGVPNYLFDEAHAMARIDYQYQPRIDAFSHILAEAMMLGSEELTTYPEQTLVIQRFDPKAIEDLLAILTPANCVFDLTAPENLTGVAFVEKEPWLKVPYTIKSIPSEKLQLWNDVKPDPKIDLPAPNPFVPDDVALIKKSNSSANQVAPHIPTPTTILDNTTGKIYFAHDDTYCVPKIFWTFEIKTPAINASMPETIVLADLYVKEVMEVLNAYTYPASIAGLNFAINHTDNGLTISIDGFSAKAEVLFLDLLSELKRFRPREYQFKIFKEILTRQYQNTALEKPLTQASEILREAIYKHFVTDKRKAIEIKKITFERFEEFVDALFNKTYVEGMMYGNLTKERAKHVTAELLAIMSSQPYPKEERMAKALVILPQDRGPFFIDAKTKAQGNAAILAIEMLPFSFQSRAAQQILMQAMREAFFSTLRTKQQTGYIVMSNAEELELHLFNIFAVQSNTHMGADLLARFELFIEGFIQELAISEITPERFENIKRTLVMTLKQPPKSITEMGMTLNRFAFGYNGDFDWLQKRIRGYEELSYNTFLDIARQTMNKFNKRRLAVLVTGTTPDDVTLQYTKLKNITQIHTISTYTPASEMIIYDGK